MELVFRHLTGPGQWFQQSCPPRTLPKRSTTFLTITGFARTPRLGKTVYADVSSKGVTSEEPRSTRRNLAQR